LKILEAANLCKSFDIESGLLRSKIGCVRALDNVSLSVEHGKVLGIVGESGSGKSTLARIICGLIPADSGSVLIDGKDILGYGRRALADKVQMVFQDPFASLNPKLSVGTILREALRDRADSGPVIETLKLVGLPPDILSLYPHQFSGGQRQRIALARSVIRRPEIIIADEPLSSLDISIQSQLLDLFLELKTKLSTTFVFISHDIVTTANFADFVIVMKDGKIVEQGETGPIMERPSQDYTRALLSSVPKLQF
jgi:ABC-type glutathione transport system ATPase component